MLIELIYKYLILTINLLYGNSVLSEGYLVVLENIRNKKKKRGRETLVIDVIRRMNKKEY